MTRPPHTREGASTEAARDFEAYRFLWRIRVTLELQFASLLRVKPITVTLTIALAAVLSSVSAIAAAADEAAVWPASPAGPETVYASPGGPAAAATEPQGPRLKWELSLGYASAYVYRGIDHSATVGATPDAIDEGGGSSFQFSGRVTLDAGGPWHPFVDLFSNYWDTDPVSNWQELRPTLGLQWQSKAAAVSAGVTSYVYPDRTGDNTSEVFMRADMNDGDLLGREQPILNPYGLVACELDANGGWYGELGISHNWAIAGLGLTVTPVARVAYTYRMDEAFIFETDRSGSGWQHADLGLQLSYRLNTLLNLPASDGNWALGAFLFRTSHLADATLGGSLTWGGVNVTWRN